MCDEILTILERSTIDDCTITLYKSNHREMWSVETKWTHIPDDEVHLYTPDIEYHDNIDNAQSDYDIRLAQFYGDDF